MHSLKHQLIMLITIMMLILAFLLNTYPVVSSRDALFVEKKSSLSSRVSVLSSSLSRLDKLDNSRVNEVLSYLDLTGLSNVVVTGSDGTHIYRRSSAILSADCDRDITTALGGKVVFRSTFADDCFISTCASPLTVQGITVGAVYIQESDREHAEAIMDMQQRILSLTAIVLVLAVFLTILFSNVLLKRIRNLVSSMQVVASGDYSYRHPVKGHDEVTELGNEFNILTERLDINERQRRQFVADASHELKTPIASIKLLSDSIVQSEGIDIETAREFVTDIGNEAERLTKTAEKLLQLSRLDDGVQIMPEPVDVKQVILDVYDVIQPLADDHSVSLSTDLEDGCVVMANNDDMFRIVFNLMENAVKYNVPQGTVSVSLSRADTVRLTVADTGIGIPEEDRLNIFSRFYRVDKARSREAGGSGLGLSIVHDTVIAHGGTITVGSNKPCGSIFIVDFPVPDAESTGI